MKDILEIIRSKTFQKVIVSLAMFLLLILVFSAGVRVGHRRTLFAYRFNEQHFGPFGGPPGFPGEGPFPELRGKRFLISRGAFGTIADIDSSSSVLLVASSEGEKTVSVASDTLIVAGRHPAVFSDLRVADRVVVIGRPDEDGNIRAKIIRIQPE